MKLTKLRLVLDLDIDPQGTATANLKDRVTHVVHDAVDNGTLTGSWPATVEKYHFKVTVRRNKKRSVKTCKKCGTPLNSKGFCKDMTCPFSDHPQSTDLESLYESKNLVRASYTPIQHPCPHCGRHEDGMWSTPCPSDDCPSNDAAEEQRRDEKNGLYGGKEDVAN